MSITPPHLMCPYEVADIAAAQAVGRGDATPQQQQRFLAWVINNAARSYDVSFSGEATHSTSFAEGRRFVGLQVVKMLKLSIEVIRGIEK